MFVLRAFADDIPLWGSQFRSGGPLDFFWSRQGAIRRRPPQMAYVPCHGSWDRDKTASRINGHDQRHGV